MDWGSDEGQGTRDEWGVSVAVVASLRDHSYKIQLIETDCFGLRYFPVNLLSFRTESSQ